MTERITEAELRVIEKPGEAVAGKVDTLLGMPFAYVLPNPTEVRLVAEVRRLRALLKRLAPVDDSLVAPVPDAGPDRIMGPIVAELLAEARAIRDDAQAAHGL